MPANAMVSAAAVIVVCSLTSRPSCSCPGTAGRPGRGRVTRPGRRRVIACRPTDSLLEQLGLRGARDMSRQVDVTGQAAVAGDRVRLAADRVLKHRRLE